MFLSTIRAKLPLLVTAASLSVIACSSDSPTSPPPPPPLVISLTVADGDGQSAIIGEELALAASVVARAQTGVAAPGVRVTFAIEQGGGHLAGNPAVTVTTDASGQASVRWTVGASAGVNRLRAFLTDEPARPAVFFTATGKEPELRLPTMTLTSLSNVGEVGTFLSAPVATLKDAQGKPMVGITVTFSVTGGGGAITGATAVTNAEGWARVGSWRLGTVSGPQTITATAPSLPTATLTVEALAGAPVSLSVHEGDGQTATVMTRVPVSPSVKLVDRYGNGVPRFDLFFKVGGESGAFVFTPFERTDANGIARTGGWNLGVRPGSYTLTVLSQAMPVFSVTFTATAVAGPPAALRVVDGDLQSGVVNTKLAVAPSVRVTDTWGNPLAIAGITVIFTTRGLSGSVEGAEQLTDEDGIARVGSWTIGPLTLELANLLTAESPGLRPTSFRATGTN